MNSATAQLQPAAHGQRDSLEKTTASFMLPVPARAYWSWQRSGILWRRQQLAGEEAIVLAEWHADALAVAPCASIPGAVLYDAIA